MSPEEIKALRARLGCSARELAVAIGEEQRTVLSWEQGELFPTKRLVAKMKELDARGAEGFPRRGRADSASVLADPAFWSVVQKLAMHPRLFEDVTKLAAGYAGPKARKPQP